MKEKEQWRPVPDYPDYDVSDLGRIRSYRLHGPSPKDGTIRPRPKHPKILKGWIDGNGYRLVTLANEYGRFDIQVHLIVARTFIGESASDVKHKNGDCTDSRLSNLSYEYSSRNAKVSDEQLRQIRAQYKDDTGPEAQKAVAEQYGVTQHTAYCFLTSRSRKDV